MNIIAHTMEYIGDILPVSPCGNIRNYLDSDFDEYKRIYEECFFDMRTALELLPVNCCDSRDELLQKSCNIFILHDNNKIIGSVAIYDNEIDDLIVAKEFQCKGYGKLLLNFAVSLMQSKNISPITLHVADWNQNAVNLYLKNGFKIIKTETV